MKRVIMVALFLFVSLFLLKFVENSTLPTGSVTTSTDNDVIASASCTPNCLVRLCDASSDFGCVVEKQCGSDGCSGSCGSCGSGKFCTKNYQCGISGTNEVLVSINATEAGKTADLNANVWVNGILDPRTTPTGIMVLVPGGVYTLKVYKGGYKEAVIKTASLNDSESLNLNVKLEKNPCGNNVVDRLVGESCELPNTVNNAYCSQSTLKCVGRKAQKRDNKGNCNSLCKCVNDSWSSAKCSKGSCGAQCTTNIDCNDNKSQTIDSCNATTCLCVHTTPTPCGNGIINAGESCELPNTGNNTKCNQSTTKCVGKKLARRDSYGNCNSTCGCKYDVWSTPKCVKGSCGAKCTTSADCNDNNPQTKDTCDLTQCACRNDFCKDSDSGMNYYVKGTVSDASGNYTDDCAAPTKLIEYACLNYVHNITYYNTPGGCTNGRAIRTTLSWKGHSWKVIPAVSSDYGDWYVTSNKLREDKLSSMHYRIVQTSMENRQDYHVKATIMPIIGIETGVCARMDNYGNGYCLAIGDEKARILRYQNNDQNPAVIKDGIGPTFVANKWYNVRLETTGTVVRGKYWLNESTEPDSWDVETTDTTYSSGKIGFYTYGSKMEAADFWLS